MKLKILWNKKGDHK